MQGYEGTAVHLPQSTVWESPELLRKKADEYTKEEPVAVAGDCKTPGEAVRSESFQKFLRVFNHMCIKDAERRQSYGDGKPYTPEDFLKQKYLRDQGFALWSELHLSGKVNAISTTHSRIQEWMRQLDELNGKEQTLSSERAVLGL